MYFLLDDKTVYIIIGFAFLIWLFIYLLPGKKNTQPLQLVPFKTNGIVGYEPRYFNNEIYSMPNGKSNPYLIYGSGFPSPSTNQFQMGFERLLPTMSSIPKIGSIQAYALQQ